VHKTTMTTLWCWRMSQALAPSLSKTTRPCRKPLGSQDWTSHGTQATVEIEDGVVCIGVGGEKMGSIGHLLHSPKTTQGNKLAERLFVGRGYTVY
jgi:hypothetical protein